MCLQNGPFRLRHHRPAIQYTRAPELDDTNTKRALYADREQTGEDVSAGTGVMEATVGLYLAYLVAVGFLPPPPPPSSTGTKALPEAKLTDEQKGALAGVGGRGTRQ
jgi:L-2-aminoadipate reductase